MAVTATSTIYKNSQPKMVQAGDNSVGGRITWPFTGPSTSAGATILLAKIPHGAQIVDFWEYHNSPGESTSVFDFGFNRGVATGAANFSCLVAAGANTTMNRFSFANWTGDSPPVVSLSTKQALHYAALVAVYQSGTTTTTSTIDFNLIYRMDGPYASDQAAGTE
jgi:hypothetical protein